MKVRTEKEGNKFNDLIPKQLPIESEAECYKLLIMEDLLEIMAKKDISQKELARRMGVSPSRITSMLNGTDNFTIETLVRAARAVGAELKQSLVLSEN